MIEFVKAFISQYLPEETEGQGLVEYALIIVLVSIACIALLGALGTKIGTVFSSISGTLT